MILSKDQGRAWLRGGWRDEPNAADIGRNIGMDDSVTEEQSGEAWYDKTRKGMEGVAEGLSVL